MMEKKEGERERGMEKKEGEREKGELRKSGGEESGRDRVALSLWKRMIKKKKIEPTK